MRDETGGTILHVRPKRLSVVNNVCLSIVKKKEEEPKQWSQLKNWKHVG